MAFFSVMGKFIAESGGPYILNETQILRKGSLKGFLKGKCYNRGKNIHQLLAVAMEIQHFRSFERKHSNPQFNIIFKHEIAKLNDKQNDIENLSKEFQDIIDNYNRFSGDTRKGKHGLTAQYWMGYIDMIHLYHEFSQIIRTGDLKLYIFRLPHLTDYFFAFNHPNYARWIVLFHDNLMKLHLSHPEVNTKNLVKDVSL